MQSIEKLENPTYVGKKYPAPNLGRDDWCGFARAWERKGQGLGRSISVNEVDSPQHHEPRYLVCELFH